MIRPKKSLGQHFLRRQSVLEEIARAAALEPGDRVLEVGAGDGALTRVLAGGCRLVIAVETDPRCTARLRAAFPGGERVRVVEADILQLDLGGFAADAPLKCVSNLPYHIATAVLDRLLEARGIFTLLVLMFQREVAQRLAASPGTSAYGALSLATQYRAECALLFRVPPAAFSPPPEVESAVVRLVPRPAPLLPPGPERVFWALVRGGFAHRRKTFLNSVARSGATVPAPELAAALEALGVSPRARAEELDLAGFLELARRLHRG